MKLVVLILCVIQLNAYEYWIPMQSAFTTNNIINNEGFQNIFRLVKGNNNGQFTSICGGVSLFGGFNVFKSGAKVSKLIGLPPHYKVSVSLEFWKIDNWDWEYEKNLTKNYVFEFAHQQPTLAVIVTTNLDEDPYNESWGLRMFTVEALICSPGCIMCFDDTPNECWYYEQIETNWFDNFNFDGWTLDNQQFLGQSSCVNIQVIGGIGQITGNKQLSKQFTSLIPHYKVILQVQLWKFDFWNNNEFQIEIDGQLSGQILLNQLGVAPMCGDSIVGEKLFNILLVKTHTSDSVQIKMKAKVAFGDQELLDYLQQNAIKNALFVLDLIKMIVHYAKLDIFYIILNVLMQNGSWLQNNTSNLKIFKLKAGGLFQMYIIINHHFKFVLIPIYQEDTHYSVGMLHYPQLLNFLNTQNQGSNQNFGSFTLGIKNGSKYLQMEFKFIKCNLH